MRTWIKNGLVCDGSGEASRMKQVLVEDDRIVQVAEGAASEDPEAGDQEGGACREGVWNTWRADRVIDAAGALVTPGFIDTHRHCDLSALYDPDFGKLELAQGLTTVIGGNCGLAPIPVSDRYRKDIYNFIEPCLGIAPKEAPESVEDYLKALERRALPLHVGTYIGTGSLKAALKGYGRGSFTKAEMEWARTYIQEGLRAGAVGLSMGIMYQPECYSSREELVDLVSAAEPSGKPLACHIRGEGDNLIPSVQEIIEVARQARIPLNISHFKITGVKNWGKIRQAVDLIEDARAKGQDVTVDFYPYCGGSTTLISLIPPSVMGENVDETLKLLDTPAGREKLKGEIYRRQEGWDNMVTAIGWERILISSVTRTENARFSGMNFRQATEAAGYEEPADFMCRLLAEEEGKVGIILLSMSQEDVDTVAKLPYSMVISDALYGVSDCPHPRLYGAFPKLLREYVRERGVLTLEEAIRKMTYLPAERLSLKDRGLIRAGYRADINIFYPEKVRDHATYENPKQLSDGFKHILVDGKETMFTPRSGM